MVVFELIVAADGRHQVSPGRRSCRIDLEMMNLALPMPLSELPPITRRVEG